jgi:hypothetical protein
LDVEPEVASREDQNRKINTKKTRNSLAVGLCAVGLFTGMLSVAQADTIAFSPTDLSSISGEPAGNDGLFFTPTTTISVTALGYVDPASSAGNAVGLYDVSTSTLLASATITSSSTASAFFLYEPITPVTLTAGDEYVVAGLFTPDTGDIGYNVGTSTAYNMGAAPDITFDGYKYNDNSTLELPTTSYSPPIVGPNFQYDVVPAPEPTTMTVIIAGALLLLPFKAGALRMLRQNRTA